MFSHRRFYTRRVVLLPGVRAGSKRACLRLLAALALVLTILPIVPLHSVPPTIASDNLPQYIDEYVVPTPKSAPLALTVDKNGIVWFTESNSSKLGRFDPASKTFKEYSVPGVGDMWGVTVDQQGYVWLTQYSGKGSVNPGGAIVPGGHGRLLGFNPATGNFTTVDIPTVGSFPFRLITDDRDRVWFTELLGNKIGVYDPLSKKLQEYDVPSYFSGPADLTFDSHGSLWFTEAYNETVAKFEPGTRTFVEYRLFSTDPSRVVSSPVGIAVTQSGNVWFADHGGNWIVEFNPALQELTRYVTGLLPEGTYGVSIPNGLLVDGQGRVWFCEHWGNKVSYFDPDTRTMVEFPIPTGPISTALWVALAPDGGVWFTEWSANKIAVVHGDLPVPPPIDVSENSLRLPAGGDTSLSLATRTFREIPGNGTFRYSWSSYDPSEVQVSFSQKYASFTGSQNQAGQAQLKLSSKTSPGNYTLGIGIDAGTVLVWRMLQVEVTRAVPAIFPFAGNAFVLVLLAGVIVVAVGVFVLRKRLR